MAQNKNYIAVLINAYLKDKLDSTQQRDLDAWLSASDTNKQLFDKLTNVDVLAEKLERRGALDSKELLKKIKSEINKGDSTVVYMYPWKKFIAAAGVAVFFVITGLYLKNYFQENQDISKLKGKNNSVVTDVPPGHDGAILKLADGSTILLDSAAKGKLANQGQTEIVVKSGQLSYKNLSIKSNSETFYNELSIPRGRKFQLQLPDGSSVWLNSSSSIRYPVRFTGNERRVELTGEAYFEVSHNPGQPFIVHTSLPGQGVRQYADVKVLGTIFNIQSYPDDITMKATLLQGSVKIIAGSNNNILKPGQQGELSGTEKLQVFSDVDTEQTIAWTKGYFNFKDADIKTVMKQISRWYNIEVEYPEKIPVIQANGRAPQSMSLANLLKILEISGVNVKIENNKIKVMP